MAGEIKLSVKKQLVYVTGGDAYITRAVRYSTIDADSVLEYAALNSGINRAMIAASMEAVLQTFENFLCNGHSVEMPRVGFFRFGVNASAASSADEGGADAVVRRKIYFLPSTTLKDLIAECSLTTSGDDDDESDSTDTDTDSDTDTETDTDSDSTGNTSGSDSSDD